MERFWNIIYYFVYRLNYKLHLSFNKINIVYYIYKLLFNEKKCNPIEHVNEAFKRPDIGLSSIIAFGVVFGGQVFFLLGLFMCFPNVNLPTELLIVCFVIAFLFDYMLLFHKDKYLKYFKEFNKKTRKWKIKWTWVTLGMILFPFLFFLMSGLVINPLCK